MSVFDPYLAYIKRGAIALLLVTLSAVSYRKGENHEHTKLVAHLAQDATAAQRASEAARKHEQQDAANSARIAQAYEQGKADAEAAGKRVADDLRSGNLKLRKEWRGCETDKLSGAVARAAEPDAASADREESAGRIVRAAREADEQIKGLQGILRTERK